MNTAVERAGAALRRLSLGEMLRRSARRAPDKTALIEGERRIAYAELDALTERVAGHLHSTGLQRAHVATLCANSIDMVAAMFGIHKSGNVWVPINTQLGVDAIAHILVHADVRAAFVDARLYADPAVHAVVRNTGIAVIVIGEAPDDGAVAFADAAGAAPLPAGVVDVADDDLALIMYTSGTTGRPKGAMHAHRAVLTATLTAAQAFAMDEHAVASCVLPLFHCAQQVMTTAFLQVGATTVVMNGFDPGAVLDAIARERLTFFGGVPLMYAALLHHPRSASVDFGSLRTCMYGLAAMPRPLLDAVRGRICADLRLGAGQTEFYPPAMVYAPGDHPGRDGNWWGRSVANVDTAVIDDDGRELGPGEVGEIVHRGPTAFLGYYKDPDATAAAQRFGWHHTGDLGRFDEHGLLLFVDRKKDMIKTGGENVASVRVEEVLLAHPDVQACAVVGLPHPHWGEAVSAFVVPKPGVACDEAGLVAHCKATLGTFEVPKLIRAIDALPLTATGKIQKHELRRRYADVFGQGRRDPAAETRP